MVKDFEGHDTLKLDLLDKLYYEERMDLSGWKQLFVHLQFVPLACYPCRNFLMLRTHGHLMKAFTRNQMYSFLLLSEGKFADPYIKALSSMDFEAG